MKKIIIIAILLLSSLGANAQLQNDLDSSSINSKFDLDELHLAGGFALGFTTQGGFEDLTGSRGLGLLANMSLNFAIGHGKEWQDRTKGGLYNHDDIYSQMIGAFIGAVISDFLMQRYRRRNNLKTKTKHER
mgnify:CR=1 FL=1|tara:strand:+ start:324 stop:719 length:396 start_codon:yes stop_codon:yes gene_type:complete